MRTDEWHSPQVIVARLAPNTLLVFRLFFSMSCSPWQSAQEGASMWPPARLFPWTLRAYCFSTPLWHFPQVFGTLVL
jgi:hypothetical protein